MSDDLDELVEASNAKDKYLIRVLRFIREHGMEHGVMLGKAVEDILLGEKLATRDALRRWKLTEAGFAYLGKSRLKAVKPSVFVRTARREKNISRKKRGY